jgi:hypothetical protein
MPAFKPAKLQLISRPFPLMFNELGRGKVNTIVEHDDINLWDNGMMRFCCWRLFCGNLYCLGFRVTAVGRPMAEYPGYFGFSLGFNTHNNKTPKTSRTSRFTHFTHTLAIK